MYSHEIDALMKKYNYDLPSFIYLELCNLLKNPQIDHIQYNAYSNSFVAWTTDGWSWNFQVHKE